MSIHVSQGLVEELKAAWQAEVDAAPKSKQATLHKMGESLFASLAQNVSVIDADLSGPNLEQAIADAQDRVEQLRATVPSSITAFSHSLADEQDEPSLPEDAPDSDSLRVLHQCSESISAAESEFLALAEDLREIKEKATLSLERGNNVREVLRQENLAAANK